MRRDFGFDRCVSLREETNLLGLYGGLHMKEVGAHEVHAWRIQGEIAENIKRWVESITIGSRAGYYHWIQRNPHILAS